MEIAQSQRSLESTVFKMLSDFEMKLNRTPAAKVTVSGLSEEFAAFKEHVLTLLKLLGEQIKVISRSQDISEMKHRRKFLLFHGLPEEEGEDVNVKVCGIVTNQLKIPGASIASFKACHRLGRPSEDRCRPVLVRFTDQSMKSSVWSKKTAFKGTPYSVAEFLTPLRQSLFMQARKEFGMKRCWSLDGNIFVKLPCGVRERLDTEEDIVRLKVSRDMQPPARSSTPVPDTPVADTPEVDIVVEAGPSAQAGRSRRANKVTS